MKILILISLLALAGCGRKSESQVESTEAVDQAQAMDTETEPPAQEAETKEADQTEYTGNYYALTGLPMEGDNDSRVYGVMIDNHKEARPQYGLSLAPIVYEYEVESSITRYLALFAKEDLDKIGPVRSARPYFIDTIMEYDAVYVRFGGSDQADEEVVDFGIDQINGMEPSSYIWRDSQGGKRAPHNAFTSSQAVQEAMENLGYQTDKTEPVFSFREEAQDLGPEAYPVTKVDLTFNQYEGTSFEYDEEGQDYIRSIGGRVQIDELNKEPVSPDNLIILFMDMGHMENGIHRWMGNVGEGTGIYINRGQAIDIAWTKDSRSSKMVLSSADGQELQLNPGQTWLAIFDPTKAINLE